MTPYIKSLFISLVLLGLFNIPVVGFAQESVDEELKALERQIEKQEAAQAEAKKKAEAEAKRKAEEERKRKEEAAARQKEEDAKKQADEEEKQKAEAERKRQEEESARQKEEEEKQKAAAERQRQEEEAARHKEEKEKAAVELAKPGREFQDTLKDGSKAPAMIVIPAGSFTMGDESNGPPHKVTIAKPFAMGKFEVTYEDFGRFCHAANRTCPSGSNLPGIDLSNPANVSNLVDGVIGTTLGVASTILNAGQTQTASGNQPVNNISWDDAKAYAQWLSEQTGKHYRLPSEAEWEYTARAGTQTVYWWGNDSGSNYANCNGCNSKWDNKRTAPVGSFTANAFGLHDTAGNVREWVGDCWNSSYNNAPADGSVWTSGDCGQRVYRGGSWDDKPQNVRSAYRFRAAPDSRNLSLGFRVLQDL